MGVQHATEPGKGYENIFKTFNPGAGFLSRRFWLEQEISESKYDLIFLDGVFEHVYNPEEM